jgi:hypothetical protein
VDSEDRQGYNSTTGVDFNLALPESTSADFSITKLGQNLLSGFFTRITTTEICVSWNLYNVRATTPDLSGNNFTWLAVNNAGTVTEYLITIAPGNYTVKEGLDALLARMNTVTGLTFTIADSQTEFNVYGKKLIKAPAGRQFLFFIKGNIPTSPAPFQRNLAQCLGFPVFYGNVGNPVDPADCDEAWIASKPNLLAFKYIDITSSQLASQQKVKDATTSAFDSIDVIYRWNFANDESYPVTYDTYGYPILPGYKPFNLKRTLSFPKQIRWNPIVPIGNLRFQTYSDQQQLLKYDQLEEEFEFKMLMLVSEV